MVHEAERDQLSRYTSRDTYNRAPPSYSSTEAHLYEDADELRHALDDEQHQEDHQQELVEPEEHARIQPGVVGRARGWLGSA